MTILGEENGGAWHQKEAGSSLALWVGPAHPAMHGTVRILVNLQGERVVDADVEIGYLHRGFEKMCESVPYNQVIPYTDRLNYVSPLINNVAWCLALEKLMGVEVPRRCQYIRVLMSEISRVCDHLTCLGASAMELGAMTVMLYMLQARESLWNLVEMVCGARLTASYCRIGGLYADLPEDFFVKARRAFVEVRKQIANSDRLLSRNRIFRDRMCDVAILSANEAINYGITGPVGRASGVNYDVRKAFPYCGYEEFDFRVPLGTKGDNVDRFNVRMEEMEQSLLICEQAIERMPEGPICIADSNISMQEKDKVYNSIEGMISHCELVVKGIHPPSGQIYLPVEGANGEMGFFVVSDGTDRPYKVHLRSPSFVNMGVLKKLLIGVNLADIAPTFGMLNMIAGECDR